MHDRALEDLWDHATPATATFDPATVAALPPAVQRYLVHTLAAGARLATTVRVTMHGSIRLSGTWEAFEAIQVVSWDRGFVWHAKAELGALPVSGYDRLVDGEAAMRWRVLGIVPIVRKRGPDIARSAAGRMHAEALWLPAIWLGEDVQWQPASDAHDADVFVRAHGELTQIHLGLGDDGALRSLALQRWGDVDTGAFHYETFGGTCEAERTFDGITLPTRYRLGWYFGTERFEPEGEFIRIEVDDVSYR